MLLKIFFIITFIHFKEVVSHKEINDYFHIYNQSDVYRGEKFPEKFMTTDGVTPTREDFTHYLQTLSRVIDYFSIQPNDTDPNVGIGSYLMKAILKRVLLDYSAKINIDEKRMINSIIIKADNIIAHFVTDISSYGEDYKIAMDLSQILRYDESLVWSMGKFNQNSLQKWITSNLQLNDRSEQFDTLSLTKEKYAEIVTDMDLYYTVSDSDTCLSLITSLNMPIKKDAEMKACRRDLFCEKQVLKMPSIAYALSHRLIYIALADLSRRCYMVSEAVDQMHMDIMCANMYRETVYLARRGYFYRDLFMEHIAFCALLGYEEFFRNTWFKKSASWIDEDGCMNENRNFELNRTAIYLSRTNSSKEAKAMRRRRNMRMNEECSHHQMALVMDVLAHGMRHAAHHIPNIL